MYLLCCILQILSTKDLAYSIACSLFCPFDAFNLKSENKLNGHVLSSPISEGTKEVDRASSCRMAEISNSEESRNPSECQMFSGYLDSNHFTQLHSLRYIWGFLKWLDDCQALKHDFLMCYSYCRDVLLSYIHNKNDLQALGSINVLSTLLQTKGKHSQLN